MDRWDLLLQGATKARRAGDFAAAGKYLDQARDLSRTFPQPDAHLAFTEAEGAAIAIDQGKWAEAETILKEAIVLGEHQVGESDPQLVRLHDSLINLYQQGGAHHPDHEAAAQAQRRVIRLLEIASPGSIDLARRWRNLGNTLYRELGRHDDADLCFKQAMTIVEVLARKGELSRGEASAYLLDDAEFQLSWGHLDRAAFLAQRALAVRQEVIDAPRLANADSRCDVAMCLDLLGRIYLAGHQPNLAEAAFTDAVAIGTTFQNGETVEQAKRLAGLGESQRQQNKTQDATTNLKHSLALMATTNHHTAPEILPILQHYLAVLDPAPSSERTAMQSWRDDIVAEQAAQHPTMDPLGSSVIAGNESTTTPATTVAGHRVLQVPAPAPARD